MAAIVRIVILSETKDLIWFQMRSFVSLRMTIEKGVQKSATMRLRRNDNQ
jgi:hypothetical protein